MISRVIPIGEVEGATALENGDIVLVDDADFRVATRERSLFTPSILSGGKNISFDPASRRLGGSAVGGSDARTLSALLERFSDAAQDLVCRLCPAYGAGLSRARTSFRPVEIAGRESSWRKDDTRLHIDSFPASPVQGRRILRVFCNVNPDDRPRSWRIGEDFESVIRTFGPMLRMPAPGLSSVLRAFGLTKTRRSRYDWLMLRLHDRMKADGDYQRRAPQATFDFPAGATWVAFTDQVSHAATAGQYQLEQTFLLPVCAMLDERRSPLRVLERLKGRSLV